MKKAIPVGLVLLLLHAAPAWAQLDNNRQLIEQYNQFASQVMMPLFQCFSGQFRAGVHVNSTDGALRIQHEINQCLSRDLMVRLRSPDGQGGAYRTRLRSLLGQLNTKIGAVGQALRKLAQFDQGPKPGDEMFSRRLSGTGQDREKVNAYYRQQRVTEVKRAQEQVRVLGEPYERAQRDFQNWYDRAKLRLQQLQVQ